MKKLKPEVPSFQNKLKKFAIILIAVAGIIAYANSFDNSFQFDDGYHIVDGGKIKDIKNVLSFSHWKGIGNRPLSYFTLSVDYQLSKIGPDGKPAVTLFHVTNLIFHILAAFMAFLLALEILSLSTFKKNKVIQDNKILIALFTALIFVTHPIQTQAVTYIIQRMAVMAGFFYMWAVLLYIRGRKAHLNLNPDKTWLPWAFYAGAFAVGALGFLSKQNAVTFPIAFILAELFFIRDNEEKIDKKFLGIFAGAVTLFIVIGLIFYGLPREFDKISRSEYLFTQFRVLIKYWQLLFLPVNQHLDYYFTVSTGLMHTKELLSLGGHLLIVALAVWLFIKKWYVPSFAIFWFYLVLSLESSVIPIRDVIYEHRLYLTVFGFGFAISYLVFYFLNPKNAKIPVIALTLLALVYAGASLNRNRVWQDPYSLWTDSVKKSPKRERSWYWLATYYSEARDAENALKCYNTSVECNPGFPLAYNGRGNLKKESGDLQGAMADYNMAIKLDPKYVTAFYNRGIAYAAMNKLSEAIKDYDQSILLGNKSSAVYYNRANAKRRNKEYQSAIQDYNEAIKKDQRNPLCYFNRGLTKAQMNNHQEAVKDIDIAIQMDPRNHLFYNGKGVSMISLNRYPEAIESFDKSIQLNPDFGQAYYNRGYARQIGLNDNLNACKDWDIALAKGYKGAEMYIKQYCGQTARR